jgi:N-acetylglutamate synthase-like GNAT family acetyltransferase
MIREATPADIPRIVEMGRRFMAESAYNQHLSENPMQMRALALQIISQPNGSILVSEKDGKLTGMLAFILFPHHFSGELIAGEVIWWVDPEARAGSTGLKLMRRAEEIAVGMGAKKMQMVAPTERIGELYKHLGYREVESTFQRNLPWQ